MSRVNSLIWMLWVKTLTGCMAMVSSLIWKHALDQCLDWMHDQGQVLDSEACLGLIPCLDAWPGPNSRFGSNPWTNAMTGCMVRANSFDWMQVRACRTRDPLFHTCGCRCDSDATTYTVEIRTCDMTNQQITLKHIKQ